MKKAVWVDGVLFQDPMEQEKKRLAEHDIDLVLTMVQGDDDYIAQCRDADAVIICFSDTNRRVIGHLPKLKAAVRCGIGYEVIDLDACTEHGVAACNIPHYCTEEVAAHAMALALGCNRHLYTYFDGVRSGKWLAARPPQPRRPSKLAFGLVGFGKIARKVAQYAKGFDFQVSAYDPFLPDEVFAQDGVRRMGLDELLESSDIISVHAPQTKENFHMIGKPQFDRMKRGGIIVNTARGGLIHQDALCDALEAGIVGGVGLDVLETEPLTDPKERILQYENVIITPHSGGGSVEAAAELRAQIIDTVIDVLDGNLPYNVLNRAALLAKKA